MVSYKLDDVMHHKIHFIGINEANMAEIALALHRQGYFVKGSAAAPFTEVATQLAHDELLPFQLGLSDNHIDHLCEAVIVGRQIETHQHPEVLAAQQLGIPVYSYPAYIYHYAQHKQRIVLLGDEQTVVRFFNIAIHVMNYWRRLFDYVAPLLVEDIYPSIHLSEAPIIFLQGDIALFSEIDPRVIASIYQPHIIVMVDLDNKLASNNWGSYTNLLETLVGDIPKAGKFLYNTDIAQLRYIGAKSRVDVQNIPFHAHAYTIKDGKCFLTTSQGDIPIQWNDPASLKAVSGVLSLLKQLAMTDGQFYEAMSSLSLPQESA